MITDPTCEDFCVDGTCVDGVCVPDEEEEDEDLIVVTENITSDVTWTSDKTYQLAGRITVTAGNTLTIEPGTVIKGEFGSGANATALLVARDGTLIADGTADLPIIFTTIADEITPEQVASGNVASPNIEPNIAGQWGGVIVLGNATISASNDDGQDLSEVQIEGIPTSDPNGLYGGTDDSDNSGIIRYISIRHGGANIGAGNEINGLTLGGVGSGTIVENIEVVSNQDDGIEWFGGTVNTSNVVVWNTQDDAIDADQSWQGTLDNFAIVNPGDHNFELDGPEGSFKAGYTIKNGSVKCGNASTIINTDDNTICNLENIYFTSIADGQLIDRVDHVEGTVNYTNIFLDLGDDQDLADFVNGSVPSGVSKGTTPQADVSVFDGWSWAAQAGGLSGL